VHRLLMSVTLCLSICRLPKKMIEDLVSVKGQSSGLSARRMASPSPRISDTSVSKWSTRESSRWAPQSTPTLCMPAARAAFPSEGESPTYTHMCGETPSFSQHISKPSAAGFAAGTCVCSGWSTTHNTVTSHARARKCASSSSLCFLIIRLPLRVHRIVCIASCASHRVHHRVCITMLTLV